MGYVTAALAVLAVLLLFGALRSLRRRRVIRASGYVTSASLFGAGALALGLLSVNLHTYQQLTLEAPVVEVRFSELDKQRYVAVLNLPDGREFRTELAGDEWQLDARMLKWSGLATILGMKPLYRLERLSGRYRDVNDETQLPRTAYQLAENDGLDIWTATRRVPGGLPWVDAVYGTATYLPMANAARYKVSITASGLLARASSPAAVDAIANWD